MQDVITSRRSIRKYSAKNLSEDQIMRLLEAGMSAPSAGGSRPWHFVVVTDREVKNRIPDIHPYSGMVRQAPVVIAVCADTALERFPGNWPLDCSAATENILLSAQSMGLGAVWLGVYPDEGRMKGLAGLFELPEGVEILSLISAGYPDETKEKVDRFDLSRVHRDRW